MFEVMFFNNGNTAFFSEEGEQLAELQKSWFIFYINFLVEKGIDPTKGAYTFPNGKAAKVFKTEDGYNWSFL